MNGFPPGQDQLGARKGALGEHPHRMERVKALTVWSGIALAMAGVILLGCAHPATAQRKGTKNGESRYWGGDEGSSRYSPLDQINARNVANLEVAWR